ALSWPLLPVSPTARHFSTASKIGTNFSGSVPISRPLLALFNRRSAKSLAVGYLVHLESSKALTSSIRAWMGSQGASRGVSRVAGTAGTTSETRASFDSTGGSDGAGGEDTSGTGALTISGRE